MEDDQMTTVELNDAEDLDTAQFRIPYTFAQQYGVIAEHNDDHLRICHREGLQLDTIVELQRKFQVPLSFFEVNNDEFQSMLTAAYQGADNAAVQMAEDIGADIDLSRLADEIPEASDLMDAEDDAPVIRLINAILSQAVRDQASDVHIETFEDNLVVRYRIDGVLSEVLSPKRMLAPLLISRLKVMAKLDIAEKRVPQDGRISVKIAGHAIDIRLSTIPSAHGERIVLRLLDKQAGQLQLNQLQMNAQVHDDFKRGLVSSHGIILVTGPTGSGKTTTLYAGLTHINESTRNILTIEDPIEYMLRGVGQTQVNTKVEMTFARGLRAILRQDPDVVMVGEIRDVETAEIAVQASLTGHLVLSTLHTNTAVGAITRLQDMGVEPFLLASSLIGVMAQRLVRLLCPECKQAHTPTASERRMLSLSDDTDAQIFRGKGCRHCNQTGYRGRSGIYEYIVIDDDLRTLIHDNAGEQALLQQAREQSSGIADDGRRKILLGETSVEEVLRVTAVG